MSARHRSLLPVGIAYVAVAVALLALQSRSVSIEVPVKQLALWAVIVMGIDLWSFRFSPWIHWSYGSAVIAAPMVLSAPGSAPFVCAILSAAGAFTDSELHRPNAGRFLANVGQLAVTGGVTGLVFEAVRPVGLEPSGALVAAVVLAFTANIAVNAAAAGLGAAYAHGRTASRGMVLAAGLLGWRKIVAAVAAAAIASTVSVVGSAWILIALVQIAALGAIPIVRARLEARRRDIMQAVTSALNAWGVVGSAHDQLEKTAVTLGHRFGLNSDQIEQVRYVSLLYSMTDHFAIALPRSFEDQLRGLDEDAFSSALLLGLPLSDVADPAVVRIAETAAEYEALVRPVDGAEPLKPNEAAAELLRAGSNPAIVAALLDERPLPDSYLRAWEIDPASLWQKPMRWMADHAL